MTSFEDAIIQVTKNVWESILGHEIQASEDKGLLSRMSGERTLTGCVQLAGAWEGAVFLFAPSLLATRLAGVMFSMEPSTLTDSDIEDAWGELGNMIAGNLKVLLPSPCQLSLPAVVQGLDYEVVVPGTKLLSRVFFDCEGEPIIVTLLEGVAGRDAEAGRRPFARIGH
jgi:chemotaxis protein CheX